MIFYDFQAPTVEWNERGVNFSRDFEIVILRKLMKKNRNTYSPEKLWK
jgi:hypothetical protein